MNLRFLRHIVIAAVPIVLIFGCGGKQAAQQDTNAKSVKVKVLAQVNGAPITQLELEQSIRASLGGAALSMLDPKARKKVLESIVAARAIAQVQAKELDPGQQAALDARVALYREQLLVRMYLAENKPVEPVGQEMIRAYYERHPGQFGAKTLRYYEMLRSRGVLTGKARDLLLTAMAEPRSVEDWHAEAGKLDRKGVPVAYRTGKVDPKVLHPRLRDLMEPLKTGQASSLTFIDGVAYAVRIKEEKKIAPQPLANVSDRIRKILLPVQLKKAVKKASEKLVRQADILYMEQ